MNGHNPHTAPLPAGGGKGELGLILPQAGEEGQKAQEPPVPRPLELPGQLRQGQEIGLSGLTLVHGAKDPQEIGGVVNVP